MKRKIVVVQDDPKVSEILTFLITQSDKYEIVDVCHDFESSMKSIKQARPHIVITDVFVASCSVFSFVNELKDLKFEPKVLIVSDVDNERTIFDTFRVGSDGFIFRSEGMHEIVSALDQLTLGNNPLSSRIIARIVSSFKVNRNSPLSERESEVMKLMSEGMTYTTIASRLNISGQTSRTHIKNIYRKLKVNSRTEAVQTALSERLI
jgi:DNA-binding NarL/FixJ family response regulator